MLKKPSYRQVLIKDIPKLIGQHQSNITFPVELIMDGKVVQENLEPNQISETWILKELTKRKLTLSEVCYAVKGTDGKLYLDLYSDNLKHPIDME